MATSPRGMDWPTAWGAMVPVYAFAAILHALFPLFAALVWLIFVIYGRKVLNAARLADDPWHGRPSPRPYLTSFVIALLAHLATFAVVLGGSGTVGTVLTALLTLPLTLGFAALFVARTAPPRVRDERALLRLGVGAEIAAGLLAPVYFFASLPTEGGLSVLGSVGALALTLVSVAAFLIAPRRADRRAPSTARKVPRD